MKQDSPGFCFVADCTKYLFSFFQNKGLLYEKLKGGPKRRKRVSHKSIFCAFWSVEAQTHELLDGGLLHIHIAFLEKMSQDLSLTVFQSANPYLMGQRLDNVVAKKSVPHFPEEDEVETATSNIKT